MTGTATILSIAGVAAAIGPLLADGDSGAKEWTAMALLAVMIAGGFAFMNKHFDKMVEALKENTASQSDVAKTLALLAHESATARADGEAKRREILDGIRSMPEVIADRIVDAINSHPQKRGH